MKITTIVIKKKLSKDSPLRKFLEHMRKVKEIQQERARKLLKELNENIDDSQRNNTTS